MTATSAPANTHDGVHADPNPTSPMEQPAQPSAEKPLRKKRAAASAAALLLAGVATGYGVGRFIFDADEPRAIDQGSFALQGELAIESALVNDYVDYVEAEAGRPFLFPPVVVAQSDTEFVDGLTELAGEDLVADDIEDTARYLQVIHGDSTGAAELEQAMIDLAANAPLGYYDPSTDKIYVPTSGGDTPDLRATIVHELVHALDDQYVDLELIMNGGPDGELEPEESAIDRLVIEGRATSVERAWRAENNAPVVIEDLPTELEAYSGCRQDATGSVICPASNGGSTISPTSASPPSGSRPPVYPSPMVDFGYDATDHWCRRRLGNVPCGR